MTNLEYYSWENLIFTQYLLGNHVVTECLYHSKHSKENIRLVSFITENDDRKINEKKIKWLLNEIDPSSLTKVVNNPQDYKHIKKFKGVLSVG